MKNIVLYCIVHVLYCIVLYCIALHCIALHCIALYCIVLYCIVLYWSGDHLRYWTADQAMHPCRPHSTVFNEHCYNRRASLKGRCSSLYSWVLKLQRKLTVQDGVFYQGTKVIVPISIRPQIVARVHSSPNACVQQARGVLFWPGMAGQNKEQVQNCAVCNEFLTRQQKEPLITHTIPDTPWSKVGQDLFTNGNETLTVTVTVDYYSDYFELTCPIQSCRQKSDSAVPGPIWAQFRPKGLNQKAIAAYTRTHFSPGTKSAPANWTVLALI